ncbi:MAG: cystathionine beta-lyase [Alphaproteobacteria bacterium]|nr:cystathionine beta-lyase [Alphaproteobacteria bacterium]
MKKKTYREDTNIAHWGRNPEEYFGMVNPPVSRASSILFPTLESYKTGKNPYIYGRTGTPLARHFEEAMAALEGGHKAISTPSGMTAISTALMAFLKAGDHLLITDSLYESSRRYCDNFLPRFGVEVEYYDPLIGPGIEKLIRKNTAVIYMESPGSGTFDMQDVPAIVKAAKKRKIITMLDNSWASGILYKPLAQGVNISILSATKYIGGHSDIMLGAAVADTEENYKKLKSTARDLGVCAGSEEMYLALRGLRTLKVRLKHQQESALKIAKWLQKRPEVQRVYYPVLANDPGHKIWKRDFKGANGLFSILLKPAPEKKVNAFADALELFPVAASWGGYESLLQPQDMIKNRSAVAWEEKGALLRLHIGLEDPDDLIADLERAFKNLR